MQLSTLEQLTAELKKIATVHQRRRLNSPSRKRLGEISLSNREPLEKKIAEIDAFMFSEEGQKCFVRATLEQTSHLLQHSFKIGGSFPCRVKEAVNKAAVIRLFKGSEEALGENSFYFSSLAKAVDDNLLHWEDLVSLPEEEILQVVPYLTRLKISDIDETRFSVGFIGKVLSKARSVQVLDVSRSSLSDEDLKALAAPELLEILDVSFCEKITEIVGFVRCSQVYAVGCESLRELGNFPTCKQIDVSDCRALVSLGEVPEDVEVNTMNCPHFWGSLEELNEKLTEVLTEPSEEMEEFKQQLERFISSPWGVRCIQRASLFAIGEWMSHCKEMKVDYKNNILNILGEEEFFKKLLEVINKAKVSLNDLSLSEEEMLKLVPHLHFLNITGMEATAFSEGFIKKLLEKAEKVNCLIANETPLSNDDLASLPYPERLEMLSVSECNNITELKGFSGVIRLRCAGCVSLTTIDDLPKCKELDCSDSPLLTTIGDLSQCISLRCSYTPVLCLIKQYELYGFLEAVESPYFKERLSLNERDEDYGKSSYYIESSTLRLQSQKILSDLQWLYGKKRQFLPSFTYLQKGRVLPAVDAGGVTRDFITKIFSYAFDGTNPQKLSFKVDENGMRLLAQDTTKEQKAVCQSIARLLGVCLLGKKKATIGSIFPSYFFACLQSGDDKHFYCLQKGIDPRVLEFTKKEPDEAILHDGEVEVAARYLFDPLEGKAEGYFSEEKGREEFKEFLEQQMEQDPFVRAFSTILQDLKKFFTPEKWEDEYELMESDDLERRIQGQLSKELLQTSLRFEEQTPAITEEQVALYQAYFTQWINEAEEKDLKNFVLMSTGSPSLGVGVTVKIDLKNNIDNIAFHTCARSIDFPAGMTYETFKESLEAVIVNAENHQGFNAS